MKKYDGYDEDLSVEENQAHALYEIAAALRKLFYAFKYGQEEGLSVAEAIEVGLRGGGGGATVAEAIGSVAQEIGELRERLPNSGE